MMTGKTTPLLLLPDELLIKIATLVIRDTDGHSGSLSELQITSVCRHLRALCICTPELWTGINLDWPPDIVQLFLRRADSQPLELLLTNPPILETTLQCLAQAKQLRFELHATERESTEGISLFPPPVVKRLKKTNLPILRVLIIRGGYDHNWRILPNFLTTASCANLVTFTAQETHISSFPHFPALRTLELHSCSIRLSNLHAFLSQTPTLERLELHETMTTATVSETVEHIVPPVSLPALRDLTIEDGFREAAMFVDMLSMPLSTLRIFIEDYVRGSPDMPYHTLIMKQLEKFWERRVGDTRRFPRGILMRSVEAKNHEIVTEIIFGHAISTSPMVYQRPLVSPDPENPVLDGISEVHLEYAQHHTRHRVDLVAPSMEDLDLRMLQHVDTLIVVGTTVFDPHAEEEASRSLEDWIISQCHRKEGPFRTVEFRKCGSAMRALFERLKQDTISTLITWVS
jgi:hypothetical protein